MSDGEVSPGPRPAGLFTLWQDFLRNFTFVAPSGDVTQGFALINVTSTNSADPDVERRIAEQVASYGRQLGWLVEAIDVLIKRDRRRDDPEPPSPDDVRAFDQIVQLKADIERVKTQAAAERVERLITQVRRLKQDPASADLVRRLRDELGMP